MLQPACGSHSPQLRPPAILLPREFNHCSLWHVQHQLLALQSTRVKGHVVFFSIVAAARTVASLQYSQLTPAEMAGRTNSSAHTYRRGTGTVLLGPMCRILVSGRKGNTAV
ncbi:hypothetical protein E2C01_006182 [Portunus trituberculatus]|uniref:Uncharacterized protein n=1 Tax=Portunus trituberculatus TaxID=210409 RepID=A0A5B7CUF9_PORTR|nr:hypothetical protein [Portunus trituberculatus]